MAMYACTYMCIYIYISSINPKEIAQNKKNTYLQPGEISFSVKEERSCMQTKAVEPLLTSWDT